MSGPGKPITPAQVRAIHVALHRQGIDDAAYRALLSHWDVGTCKSLTRAEASDLLARLGRPIPNPRGLRPSPREDRDALPNNVFRMPSAAQRSLIDELAAEIRWGAPDGYRKWLSANMGLRRITTDREAAKVIEGLRAIKRRQSKAAARV